MSDISRHDFIVITLVKIGFRTSLKGFNQFCLCVELYADEPDTTMGSIYSRVAKLTGCTVSSVEKNLRRLIDNSAAKHTICKLFDSDVCDIGNKEVVSTFANYITINRNRYCMNNG